MMLLDAIFQSPLFCPHPDTSTLTNHIYVVTGGLAGIGQATTVQLALRGAYIYVGARALSKASSELQSIISLHPDLVDRIKIFELDLASIEGTKEGAKRVLGMIGRGELGGGGQKGRLDGLVNNAGRLASETEYRISKDGIELLAQVNHFGTYTFTMALLPLLKSTSLLPGSDVRIITVGSAAQNFVPFSFRIKDESSFNEKLSSETRLNSFWSQMARYGLSKTYNNMFATELQRHLDTDNSNIISICIHPGGVATDKMQKLGKITWWLLQTFFLTPTQVRTSSSLVPSARSTQIIEWRPSQQGAYTQLYALTAPVIRAEKEKYKGCYMEPFGVVKGVIPMAADEEQRKLLWNLTEGIVERGGIARE